MAATHLGGYGCSLWPDRDRPAGVFALLEVVMENLPRLDGALCYREPDDVRRGRRPGRPPRDIPVPVAVRAWAHAGAGSTVRVHAAEGIPDRRVGGYRLRRDSRRSEAQTMMMRLAWPDYARGQACECANLQGFATCGISAACKTSPPGMQPGNRCHLAYPRGENLLTDNEVWAAIPNWESLYSISTLARVRSDPRVVHRRNGTVYRCRGRILKPYMHTARRLLDRRPGQARQGRECRIMHDLMRVCSVTTPLERRTDAKSA